MTVIERVRHKRKTKAQKKREKFAREFHSKQRVKFVNDLWCVVRLHGHTPGRCSSVIQNAHTRTGGTSRKADYDTIVPMCVKHHRECHTGQQTFEKKYGLDLALSADAVELSWTERGT